MCSCAHKKECTEEYFTATSNLEPEVSLDPLSRRSPIDRSHTEYCTADCSAASTPRTPPREFQRSLAPMTPLKQLRRRPELTVGVAVARRLDLENLTWSDGTFDETEDQSEPSFPGIRGPIPIASSTTRYPEFQRRVKTPGTYKVHRARLPQYPQAPRQFLPRMTKMTPCGKCLRM